jgi:hypothetical protein
MRGLIAGDAVGDGFLSRCPPPSSAWLQFDHGVDSDEPDLGVSLVNEPDAPVLGRMSGLVRRAAGTDGCRHPVVET